MSLATITNGLYLNDVSSGQYGLVTLDYSASTSSKINIQDTIDRVLDIFENYRVSAPEGIDKYSSIGVDVLRSKISKFIMQEKPISFVLPGFPAKSRNTRTKVLGALPDGAEEVSLLQFAKFANEVQGVYTKGASINIVSDGYVFNDMVQISDGDVSAYENECKSLVTGLPLIWHTINEVYNSNSEKSVLVEKLLAEFGMREEVLKDRIRNDPDTNLLYCGMSIFVQEDLYWPDGMSKNKIKDSAKIVAKEMIRRSEAYTGLIKQAFPESIRLSCHPSINDGTKFSWRFVPGLSISASPWHNSLYVAPDGSYTFKKRFQAEKEGLEIVMEKNRPYFFRQPGTNVGIQR